MDIIMVVTPLSLIWISSKRLSHPMSRDKYSDLAEVISIPNSINNIYVLGLIYKNISTKR